MWKFSLRTSTLFFVSGILALSSAACSSNNFAIFSGASTNAAPAVPSIRPAASPSPEKPLVTAVLEKTPTTDTYEQAIDAATPVKKKNQPGDINPQFFSVPIKGRNGGTPIVEVTFNNLRKFDMLFDTGATGTLITLSMANTLRLKPVGVTKSVVADGAVVALAVAFVKLMEIDARLKRKLQVAIAPPAMPIGLLGQDFFKGYDITMKKNVIEFRRHLR